jgi:hypothetical protein
VCIHPPPISCLILILQKSRLTGWAPHLHRTARKTRHQSALLLHNARASPPKARTRIRALPALPPPRLLQRMRPPRRDVLHHPRPGRRLALQLLPRQGLCHAGFVDWTG